MRYSTHNQIEFGLDVPNSNNEQDALCPFGVVCQEKVVKEI